MTPEYLARVSDTEIENQVSTLRAGLQCFGGRAGYFKDIMATRRMKLMGNTFGLIKPLPRVCLWVWSL